MLSWARPSLCQGSQSADIQEVGGSLWVFPFWVECLGVIDHLSQPVLPDQELKVIAVRVLPVATQSLSGKQRVTALLEWLPLSQAVM